MCIPALAPEATNVLVDEKVPAVCLCVYHSHCGTCASAITSAGTPAAGDPEIQNRQRRNLNGR